MKSIRTYGIITGGCYFIWWWAFLLFFPLERMKEHYSEIILNPLWIPVNLLQVVGVIAFACFLIQFTNRFYTKTKASGFFKLLMLIGITGFCGVAFYETFLWPIVAQNAPALLDLVSGPIYTSMLFNGSTIVIILAYWAGALYLGRVVWKKNKPLSLLYSAGVSLHCLGYLMGSVRYIVQSIGFILFPIGLILIAFFYSKDILRTAEHNHKSAEAGL